MTVLALSAERGAGKTTLAAAAAASLGAVHASVSGWLAYRLAEKGLAPTPDALRAAGARAAADPDVLVRQVLAHYRWRPGTFLVFDAVRHHHVLTALREQVKPQPLLHVALLLGEPRLVCRRAGRGDAVEVAAGTGHSTERHVPELVAEADLALDASLPVAELVRRLIQATESLR